ncbi:MAG: tripartite tricarboxylate transporter TctB family protein [Alphaproteobacteria bacterium]
MQSVDSRDKLTVLVLLAASTMFGVLANDLASAAEAAPSGPASGRLLFAAALAGSLIAVLMLLSPGKTHRSLRATVRDFWPQLLGLVGLMVGYAFLLPPLGFFLATSLFLMFGSMLLGERRLGALCLFSVPVALALALILEGVFGLALEDPLMHALGLTV